MTKEYISKPDDFKTYKPNIYVFDLDGCIADSDDFVLTNQQAYEKDPDIINRPGIGYRGKLTKDTKDLFSEAYLADHMLEIKPYKGILDLFVRMSQIAHTAIVTSRLPIMRKPTIDWLEVVISEFYNKQVWRQLNYKMFFNELNEKSFVYKKKIFEELRKTYEIALIVDDHPEVAEYAKSKKIVCLVPATGYKNLNGNDLMIAGKKCLAKEPVKRKRKAKDDNMQKKQKRTLETV